MGLRYFHLDESDVREAMVLLWSQEMAELENQGARADCYGKLLTDAGWQAFEALMPEALAEHDDDWLTRQMQSPTFWKHHYQRRKPRGGTTRVRVNLHEAVHQLCLGEFNIAYIRGLAWALRDRGETHAVVYRAGEAAEPRSECSGWEGMHVSLEDVIAGHRARYWPPPGDRHAWSLPSGPNCHHSIRAVN